MFLKILSFLILLPFGILILFYMLSKIINKINNIYEPKDDKSYKKIWILEFLYIISMLIFIIFFSFITKMYFLGIILSIILIMHILSELYSYFYFSNPVIYKNIGQIEEYKVIPTFSGYPGFMPVYPNILCKIQDQYFIFTGTTENIKKISSNWHILEFIHNHRFIPNITRNTYVLIEENEIENDIKKVIEKYKSYDLYNENIKVKYKEAQKMLNKNYDFIL